MRKAVVSGQWSVVSRRLENSGSGFVRSALSFVLAALLLASATLTGGRAFAQSTQKPKAAQAEQASKQSPQTNATQTEAERRAAAASEALVTEFDVNGLKVLVKKRAGSQTVGGGLFIRGGLSNITAENAGIESLMLDVATEASLNFPREKMRSELARTGTVLGSSESYDYSVLSFTATRPNFDNAWAIFMDVALHPSFTKEDFDLAKARKLSALSDDADDPDTYLQRLQEPVAYAGHPYLNRPEGTVEAVTRL